MNRRPPQIATGPSLTSPIPGNKLVDKPVYVLTSSRTQSAADYFVYNLKMLKRVTLVGEKTAGHQHSGNSTVSAITSAWAFRKRLRWLIHTGSRDGRSSVLSRT